MGRIDDILAQQQKLADDLKIAMKEERTNVLNDIKLKIKMFDFKANDFKGMFKSRITQKQVDEFLARKEAEKIKKPRSLANKTASK